MKKGITPPIAILLMASIIAIIILIGILWISVLR